MKIDCEYSEMVNVGAVKPHPRNNNRHPKEQLEKFVEVLKKKQVWRVPLVVSKRSGFLISGHLRLIAAKELGMTSVPVVYQDFTSDAEEYQFLTFDNEIARWAKLDYEDVFVALKEIENLELSDLGIREDIFASSSSDFNPEDEWTDMPSFENDNQNSFRRLIVHFDDQGAVDEFASLVGQKIGDKTKFIHHPERPDLDTKNRTYE